MKAPSVRITLGTELLDLGEAEHRVAEILRTKSSVTFVCGRCGGRVFWNKGVDIDPDEGACQACGEHWTGYISPGHCRPSKADIEARYGEVTDSTAEILIALRNAPGR